MRCSVRREGCHTCQAIGTQRDAQPSGARAATPATPSLFSRLLLRTHERKSSIRCRVDPIKPPVPAVAAPRQCGSGYGYCRLVGLPRPRLGTSSWRRRDLASHFQVHLIAVVQVESRAEMHARDHLYDGQWLVPGPGVVPVGADYPARLVVEAAGDETDTHAHLRGFQPRFGLMHDPGFVQHDVEAAGR